MPHIILEYSSDLETKTDIQSLLEGMHDALSNEGVDRSRIKTRAIAVPHYVVGNDGKEGSMAHITLLLLEGRDDATKKQYSMPIHQLVKDQLTKNIPNAAVTLEVRDMDKENYIL